MDIVEVIKRWENQFVNFPETAVDQMQLFKNDIKNFPNTNIIEEDEKQILKRIYRNVEEAELNLPLPELLTLEIVTILKNAQNQIDSLEKNSQKDEVLYAKFEKINPEGEDLLGRFSQNHLKAVDEIKEALGKESLNESECGVIKRKLHTLKGDFGVIGLSTYCHFVHLVEDSVSCKNLNNSFLSSVLFYLEYILKEFSNGRVYPAIEHPSMVFAWIKSFSSVYGENDELNHQEAVKLASQNKKVLIDFISDSKRLLFDVNHNIEILYQGDPDKEAINNLFRTCHTIKGVSGFLNLKILTELAFCLEKLLALIKKNVTSIRSELFNLIKQSFACLKKVIRNIEFYTKAGSTCIPSRYYEVRQSLVLEAKFFMELNAGPPQKSFFRKSTNNPINDFNYSRVSDEKIDSLKYHFQRVLLFHNNYCKEQDTTNEVSDLLHNIQNEILALRKISIVDLIGTLSSLVFDLGKTLGKKVNLEVSGKGFEIDKYYVDTISEILMHLLRNSIVHGIEKPQRRLQKNKPEEGLLKVYLDQVDDVLMIVASDDGNGLDSTKITRKAIAKNIFFSGENYSRKQIVYSIFHPDFSTKDIPDEYGGRGVGMDVIRQNAFSMNGNVFVESELNKGLKVTITIPKYLENFNSIMIKGKDNNYLIPKNQILEVLSMKDDRIECVDDKYFLDSKPLPVLGVDRLKFKLVRNAVNKRIAVIEDIKGQKYGIFLDENLGEFQVSIRSFGSWLKNVNGALGCEVKNDGQVIFVLDIQKMLNDFKSEEYI